mmetsp:Transcript_14644/g.46595  ORF Transcript_14644/g.46595 Transcript_14644/m.46595 type:complete len:222 (+) Transcript_14644:2258-2923(+)
MLRGICTRVLKEGACLLQHQLQLHELAVALAKALPTVVDLQELRLELLQLHLQLIKLIVPVLDGPRHSVEPLLAHLVGRRGAGLGVHGQLNSPPSRLKSSSPLPCRVISNAWRGARAGLRAYLVAEVPQLPEHLVAALDLICVSALEGAFVRVEVLELEHPDLAKARDGVVGGLGRDDELHKLHLLRPKHLHLGHGASTGVVIPAPPNTTRWIDGALPRPI